MDGRDGDVWQLTWLAMRAMLLALKMVEVMVDEDEAGVGV